MVNTQLATGTLIGRYKVVAPLGAGGMGEVYRARDSKIGRDVAIKLMPVQFANDTERLHRFEKEVHAAGALSHPNVLIVHDVGIFDGCPYLVSELLEGETLRQRFNREKLTLPTILDFALQFANGLAAAHEKGILHRDLKPENLFITKKGALKILDFGLAKLTHPDASQENKTTATFSHTTEAGLVFGTVPYMSPEHVLGKRVDQRSDLFAFGSILYEMYAGRPAFEESSKVQTLYSILHKEPEYNATVWDDAQSLLSIVKRCLQKDPEHRFQSAKDLAFALEALTSSGPSSAPSIQSQKKSSWLKHSAIALPLFVMLLIGIMLVKNSQQKEVKKLQLPVLSEFRRITFERGFEAWPSFSPDGHSFAHVSSSEGGNLDILLRRIGGQNSINLTKDFDADAFYPAFSPDGQHIAFESDGIYLMGAKGESIRRLTDSGHNPAWSNDGKSIIYTSGEFGGPYAADGHSELWILDISNGQKKLLSQGPTLQPIYSPRGYRIAYWANIGGQRDIWTISASGGDPVRVLKDAATDWNPIWSPDGNHLYFLSDRGGNFNLWRVAIDEKSGKVLSELESITLSTSSAGRFAISKDGKQVLFVSKAQETNLDRVTFDPVQEKIVGEPRVFQTGEKIYPEPSPDGKWIAFISSISSLSGKEQLDLCVTRTDGSNFRELTNDPYLDYSPNWSRDSKKIAFHSNRSGRVEIWGIDLDGSNLHQITDNSKGKSGFVWPVWSSVDSRMIANLYGEEAVIFDLSNPLPITSWEHFPRIPEIDSPFLASAWSPNGRFVIGAPTSTEGVYVYSFESEKYTKLTDFGGEFWENRAVWLNDNRRVIFGDKSQLYLSDIKTKKYRKLLSGSPNPEYHIGWFRISPDNRTIYYHRNNAESDIWLATFK